MSKPKTLRSITDAHTRRWQQAVRLDRSGRFVCPRHAGDLTLSPATCARMFKRGQDAKRAKDVTDLVVIGPCVECPIGARHAQADPMAAQRQPLFIPGQGFQAEPMEQRRRRAMVGTSASREASQVRRPKP